jgi:hypothetical protein
MPIAPHASVPILRDPASALSTATTPSYVNYHDDTAAPIIHVPHTDVQTAA